MKLKNNPKLYKLGLKLKKNFPDIMFWTGAGTVVAGTVVACVQTTKAHTITEKHKEMLREIHECEVLSKAEPDKVQYSEKEAKKDLAAARIKTGARFAGLYSIPTAMEAGGIALMFGSKQKYKKRSIASSAKAIGILSAFNAYRQKVKDKYGEDADNELFYNMGEQMVDVPVSIDAKTGDITTEEKTVVAAKPNNDSYVYYLNKRTCAIWDDDLDYMMTIINSRQNYYNTMLDAFEGMAIMLNDILIEVGLKREPKGQHAGWVNRKSDPNWKGDNYIDLRAKIMDVVNEFGEVETMIVLNPNVDGDVIEFIE